MGKLIIDQDQRRKWRATLTADNGRTIFASSQGYVRRRDCIHNLDIVAAELAEQIRRMQALRAPGF